MDYFGIINVTQVLDFVWGIVDVAFKEEKDRLLLQTFAWDFGGCVECKSYFDI